MTDDNVDLNFIGAQIAKLLDGQREMRTDIKELQLAVTVVRTNQLIAAEKLDKIVETQQSHGARLNGIDSRLAIIERHTGLVKA